MGWKTFKLNRMREIVWIFKTVLAVLKNTFENSFET